MTDLPWSGGSAMRSSRAPTAPPLPTRLSRVIDVTHVTTGALDGLTAGIITRAFGVVWITTSDVITLATSLMVAQHVAEHHLHACSAETCAYARQWLPHACAATAQAADAIA